MTKYINANTLVQDIEVSRKNNQHNNAIASQTHNAEHRHFIKMVLDQPAADVAPVVHGRWYDENSFDAHGSPVYRCSVCNKTVADTYISFHKFCLHCGARMDGGK